MVNFDKVSFNRVCKSVPRIQKFLEYGDFITAVLVRAELIRIQWETQIRSKLGFI